jgi:hypothetical protein
MSMTNQEREGQMLAQMRELISQQEREKAEAEYLAQQKAREARSPEGRREAARVAVEAQEARAKDLAAAKALLVHEGSLSAADVEALTEAELMHTAGFEWHGNIASQSERERKIDELARDGSYAEFDDAARLAWSKSLGFDDVRSFDRYAAEFNPSLRPTFGQPGDPVSTEGPWTGSGNADDGATEGGESNE